MQIKRLLKEEAWLKVVRIAIAVCLIGSIFTTNLVFPQTISASSDTYMLDRVIQWSDGSTENIQIDDEYFFNIDGEKKHLVGIVMNVYTPIEPNYQYWLSEQYDFLNRELSYLESIDIRLIRLVIPYNLWSTKTTENEIRYLNMLLNLFYEHDMLVIASIMPKYLPGFNNLEVINFDILDYDLQTPMGDTVGAWTRRTARTLNDYPNVVAICIDNELDFRLLPGMHWASPDGQDYTAEQVEQHLIHLSNIVREETDLLITHNLCSGNNQDDEAIAIKLVCLDNVDIPSFDLYTGSYDEVVSRMNVCSDTVGLEGNWWCLEIGYRDEETAQYSSNASMFSSELIEAAFSRGATIANIYLANEPEPSYQAFFDSNGNPIASLINLAAEIDRLQAPISRPILDYIGNKSVSEGDTLSFTVSATDPQNDSLTYSASNLPPGAHFDGGVIRFSWSAVTGATKYLLEVNSSPTREPENRLYYANVGNVLSTEVSGFPNDGTVFYLRVWAGNDSGWGVPWRSSFINGTSVSSSSLIGTSIPYATRISDATTEISPPALLSPINNVDLYGDVNNVPSTPTLSSPADGATIAGSSVTFEWDASVDAIAYRMQVKRASDMSLFNRVTMGDVTSYEMGGFPEDGTEYVWQVRAFNASGWSDYSPLRSFTSASAGSPPPVPTLFSPGDGATIAGSSVTFEWDASAGAIAYRMQVKRASDLSLFDRVTLGNVTSYEMGGFPEDGTEYVWQVRAYNANGWSDYSTLRSFTNAIAASPPPTPVPTSPADGADVAGNSITFDWDASAGAIAYRIQVKRASDLSLFDRVTLGDVTSYEMGGFPEDGTEYVWQVRAANTSGWSDYSEYYYFTSELSVSPLSAPTLLYPQEGATVSSSASTFSWTPADGQAGMYINIHFEVSDGEYTDFEDIAIAVSSSDASYVTLRPNINGAYTELTPVTGGSNYTKVDEGTHDDWETIVAGYGDTYLVDTYQLLDPIEETGTITGVTIFARVHANEDDGSAQLLLWNRAGLCYGNEKYIPCDNWTSVFMSWDKNPWTNLPWTWRDVKYLQAGIALRGTESTGAVCTQLYAVVSYNTN